MTGSGTTTLSASCVATLGGVSAVGFNRNLTNAGTVNWTGGSLGGYAGPGITFTNNGTFNANLSTNSVMSANSFAQHVCQSRDVYEVGLRARLRWMGLRSAARLL
jgi:hypothetical protein